MPLENATFLHQVNPKLPLGTDPVASIDDHVRQLKQVLLNTFPNLDGPLTLSASTLNGVGVPSKGIIMYSGAVNTIPTGWRLCDGQFGTPDLRDRFIVGAGGQFAVGTKGGSAAASVTGPGGAHSHTVTGGAHAHSGTVGSHALTVDEMPRHQHATSWGESNKTYAKYGVNGSASGYQGSERTDHDNYEYMTSEEGRGQPHTHSLDMSPSGDHGHTVVSAADHTHTVDVKPPYYALAYIMKE